MRLSCLFRRWPCNDRQAWPIEGLAAAGGLACSPDLPSTRWTGSYLLYATDRDDLICEGTFTVQDRFVEALAEEFGATIGSPIPFAYITDDELAAACRREHARSCCPRVG